MPTDLADELRVVMDAEDGRTLIEIREAEPHYDVEVQGAEYDGEGTTVSFDDGLTTYLTGREIKVGDTITIWDGHHQPLMGGTRHGWAHNGELIEWLTPFQRIANRVTWLADHDRDKRERLERGAEKRAADYETLPAPLKARIDRFVAERPDFWLTGDYELFCCTEAAKIAEHLRPRVEAGEDPDAIVSDFHAAAPAGVVSDQHSGNTFGGACALARALLRGEPV